MAAPSVWVPCDIAVKAECMINNASGDELREGVELLLSNDLSVGGLILEAAPGRTDAGSLLAKGLANIAKFPHQALGVPLGAQTIEIKKAYKKMALKYHPDKNPVGTPIFQAIKTAFDKLEDRTERSRVEAAAAKKQTPQPAYQQQSNFTRPPPPPANQGPFTNRYPAPNSQQNKQQSQSSNPSNPQSGPTYHQKPTSFPNNGKQPYQQQSSGGNSKPETQQKPAPTASNSSHSYQHFQANSQQQQQQQQQQPAGSGSRKDEAYREWAKKEEAAQKHREEILRKAYFDQQKSNAEKIRKHEEDRKARRATFDEGTSYDSKSKPAPTSTSAKGPTPTPDERSRANPTNGPASGAANGVPPGAFKSFRPGAYPGAGAGSENQKQQAQQSQQQQQQPQHQPSSRPGAAASHNPYAGKTFTTDAQGNIRMMGAGNVPKDANGIHHNSYAAGNTPATNGYTNNPNGSGQTAPPASNQKYSHPRQTNPANVPTADAKPGPTSSVPKYSYPQGNATPGTSTSASTSGNSDPSKGSDHRPSVSSDGVPLFSSKALVPRPFQLKCTSLGSTVIDLEWKLVRPIGVSRPIPVSTYAIELNWRDRSTGIHAYNWEAAKQLISGNTCRKKNLIPGKNYDLRIRAVEELAGGMLGGRGEWSEILSITTKQESPNNAAPSTTDKPMKQPQQKEPQASRQSQSHQHQEKQKDNPQQKSHKTKEQLYSDPDDDDDESTIEEESEEDQEAVEEIEEDINIDHIREQLKKEFDLEPTQTPRDGNSKHAWKHSPENTETYGHAASSASTHSTNRHRHHTAATESSSGEEEWRPNRARAKAKAKSQQAAGSTASASTKSTASTSNTHTTPPSKKGSKHAPIHVWHELFDESGNAYYYNESTGESKWEAPEWVEEFDANSGASYYVKLNTYGAQPLHSTWSKPHQFAQLIRQAGAHAAAADNSASASTEEAAAASHASSTIYEEDEEDNDDYGEIIEEDDEYDAYFEAEDEIAEEYET